MTNIVRKLNEYNVKLNKSQKISADFI